MNSNPLASGQREKSGATTFGKYEYQYHWALCRIIDEQLKTREYAVFMELHEDVVLADSLEVKSANFEFNQVKNIQSPKFNIKNLTKKDNGSISILGKLIDSAINKPFSQKVTTINLVASCGFKFDQINNDLNLELITVGDLSKNSVDELKAALFKELGIKKLPNSLRFIVPKLNIKDQQDSVIGKIASLVSSIFPGSHCNAENIYRVLIDDLHRKGSVHYDYTKWDELLKNKALTSTQVKGAISTHVSLQNTQTIQNEANDIAKELGLNYFQKNSLRRNIERIHIKSIGFPTTRNLKIKKEILNAISSIVDPMNKDVATVIDEVELLISEIVRNEIGNSDDVRNNIIYEMIVGGI